MNYNYGEVFMNLQFTQEELDFQKEVKDWIKENLYMPKAGPESIGPLNMEEQPFQHLRNIFTAKKWLLLAHLVF